MQMTHCTDVPEIKAQHKDIIAVADEIVDLSSTHNEMYVYEIFDKLKTFKQILREHIDFENKNFYDKLFKDMWEDGENTEQLELFIKEMKKIADVIFTVLDKYQDSEDIRINMGEFSKNFGRILGILMLRIESEENSTYILDC